MYRICTERFFKRQIRKTICRYILYVYLYLDAKNKISGIPQKVYEYKIGTKSALDWVVEYHKFKKLDPEKELHHKTLIEEDLDTYDWKSIRTHLLELIPKIITVSLDTLTIYDELDSKK